MAKNSEFGLNSMTQIKIFLLYLLDNIRYPIEYSLLSRIISESTDDMTLDYEECLRELADMGHLWFDEMDGEKYYMISDSGRLVAAELYDSVDADIRERGVSAASRLISLRNSGASISATVQQTDNKRFKVTLDARDPSGEYMSLSLTVATESEAELIRDNFKNNPDGVYRGILFSATGRFEFMM
jgi:hypothetical protein